jgi:anti-sigma regulatory factor (Ser/Thr protein kinase)
MGIPVGTEPPDQVTSNRGACLDEPPSGSVTLGPMPLQPRPRAAWAELFPVEPTSPQEAREVTRWFLGNCQGVSSDTADTAVLLVSELVTNAYAAMTRTTNGIPCIGLSLRLFTSRLLTEVTDSSPRVPALTASGPDAVSGRGLSLTDELSQQWGYFWHRTRKVVYFTLSTADSPNTTSA